MSKPPSSGVGAALPPKSVPRRKSEANREKFAFFYETDPETSERESYNYQAPVQDDDALISQRTAGMDLEDSRWLEAERKRDQTEASKPTLPTVD